MPMGDRNAEWTELVLRAQALSRVAIDLASAAAESDAQLPELPGTGRLIALQRLATEVQQHAARFAYDSGRLRERLFLDRQMELWLHESRPR